MSKKLLKILIYLAGIASEAIMFFSPTMYASGARVYYLTDILYLFIILCLVLGVRDKKWQNGIYVCCVALGLINFIAQFRVFMSMI